VRVYSSAPSVTVLYSCNTFKILLLRTFLVF